ncbi:MAG: carboxypeptidase regulatory-like domain-containing protein [Gemmatimonadota bacterium]
MSKRHRVASFALFLVLGGSLGPALAPAAAQGLDNFERARLLRVRSLLDRGAETPTTAGPAAKAAGLAASSGTISGTVRGLEADAYGSAWITAWPADSLYAVGDATGDSPRTAARALVEPDGTYRLEGLAPGPYYVSAAAKEYETRYYDGATDLAAATAVEVPEDGSVEGIDFALERYNAGEGSIAGTVTNEVDGHPIAGAIVHAFAPDNPYMYGATETDGDGRYAIRGLRSGRYVVEAWHQDYMSELYGDATAYEQAVLVEVTEPQQTGGIDFGLAAGGAITGVVRDGEGEPVAGAYVNAILTYGLGQEGWADGGPAGELVPAVRGGWAVTDEGGVYHMGGLPTGEYRVQAQFSSHWVYVSVWYAGAQTYEEAAPVAVTLGQETAGIDMALDLPAMGSAISGQVTDPQGHPVTKAFVTVQAASEWVRGETVTSDDTMPPDGPVSPEGPDEVGRAGDGAAGATVALARVWAYAATGEDGRYVIDELPAGTYIVGAAAENGWEYVQRWYVDAAAPQDAEEVVLGAGERLADIDIVLPLRVASSSISGTVRDQDGKALAWAYIEVGPAEGAEPASRTDPARLWAYGQADSAGAYQVDRLPAGTYTVHASYSSGDRFGQGWYDGAGGPQEATPVVLAEGEARTDISLELVVRPIYGVVTGTVTDAASGSPVERAYVVLSPRDRDVARGAPLGYWTPAAVTDASGGFRLEWIPEGAYSLTVYANGATADYVAPDAEAGVAGFAVRGGETARCDVALTTRQDGEGVVTGTVTTAYGGPGPLLRGEEPAGPDWVSAVYDTVGNDAGQWGAVGVPEIAVVMALPAGSPAAGAGYTAVTDPDGRYALRGLAPGDYVIMCFAAGHIGTYYDGAYAPDKAEKVQVDGALPVAGIDFELAGWYFAAGLKRNGEGDMAPASGAAAGGAMVYGKVADDSGQPVENATVYLLNADEQPVAFAQTGSDGNFEMSGVEPGEYRVYAGKLGLKGSYNGNELSFGAATSLPLEGGQTEVNLILRTGAVTAVGEDAEGEAAVPVTMALQCNYPNPFNPETRIAFSLPGTGRATLSIYNALGQPVAVLFDEVAEAGRGYEVVFRAPGLGAGTYFYSLAFQGQQLTRSMALVK